MTTIIAQQKDLQKALTIIQPIIPSRPQIQILSNILLTIHDSTATFSATDLYLSASTSIPVQCSDAGNYAIPGKQFFELIRSLSNQEITIEIADSLLTLQCEQITSVIQISDGNEFPLVPSTSGELCELSLKDLDQVTSKVIMSTSTELARPLLTGVVFEPGEILQVVATDGFRLSLLDLNVKKSWPNRVIVPARFFSELAKMNDKKQKNIELVLDDEQKIIKARVGDAQIFCRILEGEYPPYHMIIPTNTQTTLTMQAGELLDQIKRALIFARDSMNAIQLILSQDNATLKAQSSSLGQFSATLRTALVEGNELSIAFNSRYLLDFLQVDPESEIVMECTDSLRPVLLTMRSNPGWRYVVMPFRMTNG